jgi:hypothetical protein
MHLDAWESSTISLAIAWRRYRIDRKVSARARKSDTALTDKLK